MDAEAILLENGKGIHGALLSGCVNMYRATGINKYRDAALNALHVIVSSDGELLLKDHSQSASCGGALLFAFEETGEDRYKTAAQKLRDALRRSFLSTQRGLYLSLPFIAEYDTRFGDKQSYKEIVARFQRMCYGKSEDEKMLWFRPITDSPEDQDAAGLQRAGRLLAALADTIEKMDIQLYEHYRALADLFLTLIRQLLPFRDQCSLLFSAGIVNPEEQADALGNLMIVYALRKGVRLGLIDEEKYLRISVEMMSAWKERWQADDAEKQGFCLMIQAEEAEGSKR